jgi:hypothetical protein
MNTNRKVFRNSSPALGAKLRCIFGRDSDYFSPSLRRFEEKYTEEPEPSYISHRPCEWGATIPRVHLFDTDGIIAGNKPVSSLEVEVSPLVIDLFVGLGDKDSSLLPTVRAFDSARKPSLPHSKNSLGLLEAAWVFNLNTFRCGEKGLTADINAYCLACLRERPIGDIVAREGSKPFVGGRPADGYRFDVPFNRARQPELEGADILDSEIFTFQLPARLLQSEAVIPVSTLETGEAWLFTIAILNSSKEALKGFVQTLKHFLKNLRAHLSIFREASFEFRELLHLAIAGNRAFVLPIDGDALRKSGIVEVSTEVEPMFGLLKSLRIGLNAILKTLFHLPCTMLNIAYFKKGVKRLIHPPAKAGGFLSPDSVMAKSKRNPKVDNRNYRLMLFRLMDLGYTPSAEENLIEMHGL